MRFLVLFCLTLVLCLGRHAANASFSDEEASDITEACCSHGERFAATAANVQQCNNAPIPADVDPDQSVVCLAGLRSCCMEHYKSKEKCDEGMTYASAKRCSVPASDIGKTCCEECSIGQLTGESQGLEACGGPSTGEYDSPSSVLRKNAYHKCCVDAANKPTTTEPPTTTPRKPETTTRARERCKPNSCDHLCNDEGGRIRCSCREGYRLFADKRTCKDINECAEAVDDLCIAKDTVCHNVPGSFKCVPIKKRDSKALSCPAGFKRNVQNQVCDDINECQSPRPPCPKYLCENTIGGYKCAGKPGTPYTETDTEPEPEPAGGAGTSPRNDICPPGFRSGDEDDCVDIDECVERTDDCQRLSQHCINTHGSFFCQDFVSKRCQPGFRVKKDTGICEDIDECEESAEVCQRNEVCVNMPGAYSCKSKISTLPKLGSSKTCQEGTRLRPGSSVCEDIDECREGTHLCDQFQKCVNTYGGHECQCKNGFELDSSGSCVDIDECALKLDNCREGTYCLNTVGTFTCTRNKSTTAVVPTFEYDYYDESNEDNAGNRDRTSSQLPPIRPPKAASRPTFATSPPTTTLHPTPTTRKPTTSTSTPKQTPQPTRPPYVPRTTTTRRPYTNRPRPIPNYPPVTPSSGSYDSHKPLPTLTPAPPRLPERPRDSEETPTDPAVVRPIYTRPENRRPNEKPARPNATDPVVKPPKEPVSSEDSDTANTIDTSSIPKHRWTNISWKENKPNKPDETDVNLNELHCLSGYKKNEKGDCVDINECESNTYLCSNFEDCENRAGGYICVCKSGYTRDSSGWCKPSAANIRPTTASNSTTTQTPPPPPALPSRPHERPSYPQQPPPPPPPAHHLPAPECELGYYVDRATGRCVDIDECATRRANCAVDEDCVNVPGGYRCVCGGRCRAGAEPTRTYVVPPTPDSNVITVGAQYGQRGPRYLRPTFTRLPNTGAVVSTCPWGYKLTADKMCLDIDECAKNVSECGPQQKCENFFGGYSCQCPPGHKLSGQSGCEDIDECSYGKPCAYNSECINTIGSYRCACSEGFRNAASNDRVCVDVDECSETPPPCHQGCANSWGSYRCYCQKGYRLIADNRTCEDVDECAEWAAAGRGRGARLCGGACVNVRGSYRCSCPPGYRLGDDARSCIDIDECASGEARCARGGAGEVCQNTRGGYHCHTIRCPAGYRLDSKHRCSRIQRQCPISDWNCLHQPSSYSYNFITFVSNMYLPEGSVDLFTMHGPAWAESVVTFEMRLVDVQAAPTVKPVDISCFDMRPSNNVCVVSLVCSPAGPQVAELELTMSLHRRHLFAGSAVARLVVIVSQYDF